MNFGIEKILFGKKNIQEKPPLKEKKQDIISSKGGVGAWVRKLQDVKKRRGGGDKSSLLATYSIEGWLLMGDICMWKEHARDIQDLRCCLSCW